jgi:hypothetical protein
MLKVTRWFIKAGMVYLVTGVFLFLLDSIPVLTININLLPVYWHMIALGWITQVIIGVSIWMFPRKKKDRKNLESPVVWAIFWTLNAGLILRFLVEPFPVFLSGILIVQIITVLSVILQLIAAVLYLIEIWPRVQPRKQIRRS